MSANGIAHLSTKELRQKAKLDLAASNRAADSNPRATYDLTQLPTQYNDNSIVDNPNTGGLVVGRPWITTSPTFTFYEAFGTTSTISTTQYVSGNKIYAESSTYDVPSFQNARIVVNDIEIVNTALRGHTLAILDSYGDTVSITRYDTWDDPATLATLATALNTIAPGNIAVLVTYDASALNSAVRSVISPGIGSTNSNTWTATRQSQIFIGIKKSPYGSLAFNGSSYIALPTSDADLLAGTGDFTIQMRIRTTATGLVQTFVDYRPLASGNYIDLYVVNGNNKINLVVNSLSVVSTAVGLSINTWYHFALVRSGSGANNIKMYLNGTLSGTGTSATDFAAGTLNIGRSSLTGVSQYFNGNIADFEFIKGTALYTSDFTVSPAPSIASANTKLLLHAVDNATRLTDSSGLNKTVTNNGVTWSSTTPF